jgi:hypothetical protein
MSPTEKPSVGFLHSPVCWSVIAALSVDRRRLLPISNMHFREGGLTWHEPNPGVPD